MTDILEWANGRFYPNIPARIGVERHEAGLYAGAMR